RLPAERVGRVSHPQRQRTRDEGRGQAAVARLSIAAGIAQARAYLHRRARRGNRLVFFLQAELDAVLAGQAIDVVCGEAPLDLALAGLVGIAIGGIVGARVIAPIPFDAGAIVVFVI